MRFEELNDEQLLALTDEQVERYKDIACAEAGVPFLPPAPKEPEPVDTTNDLVAYEVPSTLFVDPADAQAVAAYISQFPRRSTAYLPGTYAHLTLDPEEDDVAVSPKRYMSRDKWAANRASIALAKASQEKYKQDQKAYDQVAADRAAAHQPVRDRITQARDKAERLRQYNTLLDMYLDLAEGDGRIARNFLRKANPALSDEFETVEEVACESA